MGKVYVKAKLENLADVMKVLDGEMADENVRFLQVDEALIDTGATMLSLPRRLIQSLGLRRRRTRIGRTTGGAVSFDIYQPVLLTIQERDCVIEVAEVPDDCPPLIGQIPLEMLDFVVDPAGQKLIGNPEHGGEHMIELY